MSTVLTLTTYFAERQRSGDRFLADAVLDLIERRRVGASVMLRGIASFGPTQVIRSDRSLSLSEDPPVTITAVDTADRITALADEVATLIGRGVITLQRGFAAPAGLGGDGAVRLSLQLTRRHRIAGVPGYVVVCEMMHRHGFAGADAYLGVDGTVGDERRRARFFSRNAEVPLSIVGVGTGAQAAAVIDELAALLPDASWTAEPVVVCKAGGRTVTDPVLDGSFHALTVHTSESSRHDGRPIHRALIRRLKESDHASGATALRGIWGFRGPERPHGDRLGQLVRHVPVTTVIVDTAANIAATYPIVDELTAEEGLVTVGALAGMLERHSGQAHGSLDLGDDPYP